MKRYNSSINGVTNRIVTPVSIDVTDYPTKDNSSNKINDIEALWDTGATVTVLSEELIRKLGLTPRGITKVSGFDGKPVTKNTYKIDLLLGEVLIEYVDAIEAPLLHSDMLLGMNVIGQGDLHIVHPDFKTIDIVFEIN